MPVIADYPSYLFDAKYALKKFVPLLKSSREQIVAPDSAA